jgi:hypothetical protein
MVSAIDPGASRLASSNQASGDAPAAGPVVGLGNGLLLGGELLGPFPLPPLLPWASTGTAMASASAALAIIAETRRVARITDCRRRGGCRCFDVGVRFSLRSMRLGRRARRLPHILNSLTEAHILLRHIRLQLLEAVAAKVL